MNNPSMRRAFTRAQNGEMAVETRPATYGGIALKSVYYAAITVIAAVVAVVLFQYAVEVESEKILTILLIAAAVSAIAMVVFSLIIMFAPSTVLVVGTLYSLCQGILLGMVVLLIDTVFPGIALAAVLGTVIVFLVSIVMNKFLSARVTNSLLRVCFIGFISLILVELGVVIVGLITASATLFQIDFWLQFAITAFCVFYASVMLMWDLQTANDIVQAGADKRYEWTVAFSLVTTLVYLYIEILELLIRLAMIFGRNKN